MLLAKIDSSTEVTVGADIQVAGRAAYNLVLTPKSEATLVSSVAVAVDGQTGLPLGVQVRARGQADPVFGVAYTSLTLGAPDASLFNFSSAPGCHRQGSPGPGDKQGTDADARQAPPAKDSTHKPAVDRLRLGLGHRVPGGEPATSASETSGAAPAGHRSRSRAAGSCPRRW